MNASNRLRIWWNPRLADPAAELFRSNLAAHELVFSSRESSAPAAECDVAFGQPEPAQIISSTRLRWVQISSAGYTRYDRDDIRAAVRTRGAVVTNSSDVFADPCAQHLLGCILAQARGLPEAADAQRSSQWLAGPYRGSMRTLGADQTVLIAGYGEIGARLAELLEPFGTKTIGVRQTPRGDERIAMHPVSQLPDLLPQADHVVNVLPLSESTREFFNAERFAMMKPSAAFYNVGRGDTVDQAALRDALMHDRLAAAWLDVTTPEPLPADDPLWKTPRCHITPHVAGGMQEESVRLVTHFLRNVDRYQRGEPLRNRIM